MEPVSDVKVDLQLYDGHLSGTNNQSGTGTSADYVQGEMQSTNCESETVDGLPRFNTLDEPIKDTVLRDLRAVGAKFLCVIFPGSGRHALLREWDLWGPLILCTILAVVLRGGGTSSDAVGDGGPEFAEVFVIVWVGSAAVTVNTKLLGGTISFFQSVCVLGYCLFPSIVSLIVCRLLLLLPAITAVFVLRLLATCVGFAWALFASVRFLGDLHPPDRRALGLYPIGLFYFIISWLILAHAE